MKTDTRWRETPNGGIIRQTGQTVWMAAPSKQAEIRPFTVKSEAIAYAEGE